MDIIRLIKIIFGWFMSVLLLLASVLILHFTYGKPNKTDVYAVALSIIIADIAILCIILSCVLIMEYIINCENSYRETSFIDP